MSYIDNNIPKKLIRTILGLVCIGAAVSTLLMSFMPVSAEVLNPHPPLVRPTNPQTIADLASAGVNATDAVLEKGYDASNHYTEIWLDTKTDKRVAIVSSLPMSTADGQLIAPHWTQAGAVFNSGINLFTASVNGATISVVALNDQPTGKKKGDMLVYSPSLKVGGNVVALSGKARTPTLLEVDPINPNYTYNTLVWDYGVCKRYLRLLEGSIQGYWIFSSNPAADIQIDYSCYGTLALSLGQYAVDKDTEFISKAELDNAQYPLYVGDSLTFYPNANPESTSVDGGVGSYPYGVSWATIKASGGDEALDDVNNIDCWGYITSSNLFDELYRGIFLFNTSDIPDTATISSATFSVYGNGKNNTASASPVIKVFSSAPASNTSLSAGDFDSLGSTAYCDSGISYNSWSTTGYNDFTLNSTGIAAINKTGITKFGLQDSYYDDGGSNTPPTSSTTKECKVGCYCAEEGSGYKPKLVVTYTTTAPPTVTTSAATNVESTTATGNGNITSTNGDNADIRGIVWDDESHGDPGSAAPDSSGYPNDIHEHGDYGTGAYTISLTGLPTGTTIYARAYAHNDYGYDYGSEVSWLTKPSAATNVAASDGTSTTKVVVTWTKSTGATGYKVYEGANLLDTLGDVATYDDTAAPAPTITAGTATASDGTETGYVTLTVTGQSASNGASRTYKVVAFNATGDADDSATDTGYRGTTTLTYQWRRSAEDSDAAYSNIAGGTTNPYNDTGAPAGTVSGGTATASDGTEFVHVDLSVGGESKADGAGRWYYCVVSMTGAASQDTTHDRGYRTTGDYTYQWYRSSADADADFSVIAGGTTKSYEDTGAPADGSGRWYYCEVGAVGATSGNSTHNRGYRDTTFTTPTVSTNPWRGYGPTWAVLAGEVTDEGDGVCTEVGFDYGLTDAYGSEWTTTDGSWSTADEFVGAISGLSRATVIHYRAKAKNAGGWGYGDDMVVSTEGSASIYEYMNENGDGDSAHIYGANWGAQAFLAEPNSHTVSFVRIKIKRTGSPSDITISIKHGDINGLPTGDDIAVTTIDGDLISTSYTWYKIEFGEEVSLEIDNYYCIVVRANAGDTDNNVQWQKDTGGDGDNVFDFADTSSDGGISWASASPADYLFEVWGYPCIDLTRAAVYRDYIEEGDMLFLALYKNTYPPYYPDEDPSRYFYIQVLATDGVTVLNQTPCRQWGYMPAGVYFSAEAAASLNDGAAYYMSVYGNITGTPSDSYQLTAADWLADGEYYLHNWVLLGAEAIATYYTEITGEAWTLTENLPNNEKVLNENGGTIFSSGIAGLMYAHPDLFKYSSQSSNIDPDVPDDDFTGAHSMENMIGANAKAVVDEAAIITGVVSGKAVAGFIILAIYLIIAVGIMAKGHASAGLALAFPFLGVAAIMRVIDYQYIAIIALVCAGLLVWSFYWTRT